MAAFGQDLKAQRERLGISLQAMAAETRVMPRHLEALEAGEFDLLPGGVFRRGILRAYLQAMHLEQEPWTQRFQEALTEHTQNRAASNPEPGPEAWATFAENVRRSRATQRSSIGLRWSGVLLLLLVLVVGGLAIWRFVLHRGPPTGWHTAAPSDAQPAPRG